MEFIEVEYNQELHSLETVLLGVKQPGDFFVAGTLEIPMPRVEVADAGVLSFPIPAAQIEAMVRHASRAPYGRGEQTIVDTSVRNVWQIAPRAVKISGKSWPASFESILAKVKAGLGCQGVTVSAELYKLLIYDRGGFFLAHRDTEKSAGMFGTLVLTLPSFYSGGALRIRHASREATVETGAAEPSEISFAAFYADCEHEALPVREGNRVCLVYNLIQERPKQTKRQPRVLRAPNHTSQAAKVAAMLADYWRSPHSPPKIAWLLEHQYSPAGLSFSSLKGADDARARVLVQAAAEAQGAVHLAVVHIEESGAAEEEFYAGPRRGGYRDFDDDFGEDFDDDWNEPDDGDYGGGEDEDVSFTPISVDSGWQYLDEWRGPDDRKVEFGRIPLREGELLPAGALDGEPPDEQRLTEASGNEGATYERSYHRAALVLWPANRMLDVLLGAGVPAALPYLEKLSAGGKSARPEAMEAAERLVEAWPGATDSQRNYHTRAARVQPQHRAAMVGALVKLQAPKMLEQFIVDTVTPAYDGGDEEKALVAAAKVLGEVKTANVFAALVAARMPFCPQACADLLLALAASSSPLPGKIAEAAVAAIDGIGRRGARTAVSDPDADTDSDDRYQQWEDPDTLRKREPTPEFIEGLFSALAHSGDNTLFEAAARKIASRPEVFDAVRLVVPSLGKICAARKRLPALDPALEQLWTGAAEFLLGRSEVPPQPPADWRLNAKIACGCADCQELLAFASDPVERTHRFRVKKERRSHLHRMIDSHRLDISHVTERVGSPQTLVCTKTRRTFQARMKEYQEELAAMRDLVKLARQFPAATGVLSKRMEAAMKAGKT